MPKDTPADAPLIPTELLTPGEVADLFRVDPKTVTRWGKSGRLRVVRTPGGHSRYHAEEVWALLTPAVVSAPSR